MGAAGGTVPVSERKVNEPMTFESVGIQTPNADETIAGWL
jgi:hypothetical protein